MITLDTSALFALLNRSDRDHVRVKQAFLEARRPHIVPIGILAEIGYLIERRLGQKALVAFLGDLQAGSFTLDCGKEDVARIARLVQQYADLPLGLADACVAACAQRNGGKVLSTDQHFQIVSQKQALTVLP